MDWTGAAVRDRSGRLGRVQTWQLPVVVIGWDEGALLLREEVLSEADLPGRRLEILDPFQGWTAWPAELMQARLIPLAEAKAHNPFKRKAKIGPGPRRGTNAKSDGWNCDCADYKCRCKGRGDNQGLTKDVDIDPQYKSAYNREYKKWQRDQG